MMPESADELDDELTLIARALPRRRIAILAVLVVLHAGFIWVCGVRVGLQRGYLCTASTRGPGVCLLGGPPFVPPWDWHDDEQAHAWPWNEVPADAQRNWPWH
jgi:hypothetical protein